MNQRLVADHVDPRFHERLGHWEMQMIGGYDGHGLDAVVALGFTFRHFAKVAVNPIGSEAQFFSGDSGPGLVARERTGHQRILIIHARRQPVYGTDERPLPAPNHSEPDSPTMNSVAASLDRHCSSLKFDQMPSLRLI